MATKNRKAAVQAIKEFTKSVTGTPAAAIALKFRGNNPYKDGTTIEAYIDAAGFEYWVNKDNKVIQAGPTPTKSRHATVSTKRLTVAELREKAIKILSSQVQDFATKKKSMHPLEDSMKKEVYFFRWDDFTKPSTEDALPPFAQVALHADGTFASMTNTL